VPELRAIDDGTEIIGFDPLAACAYPWRVNRVVSGAQGHALLGGSSFQVRGSITSHVQSASTLV
jgi:hypothetical protein